MNGTVSPVQSRRLARTLRRWREHAGYSIERAAEELLCGMGTVSRMETGDSAQPLRVRSALELYGAPKNVIADMVEAAKLRNHRGVLRRPYYDFVSPTFAEYLDLENEASELSCFQSDIVPGLLQTEHYARALIKSADEVIPARDRDKFLRLRMERQERLKGGRPRRVRFILTEGALYTEVGGPSVLRDQLQHMLELCRTAETIQIRVLPFTAGGPPSVGRDYIVLAFPGAGDQAEPEAVLTTTIANVALLHDNDEVARYQRTYDQTWSKTLDPAMTIAFIRRAIAKLRF